MKIRTESGFSLVELMVVMALMGIAALGISRLLVEQAKQQKQFSNRANIQQIRSVVQEAAKDPGAIEKSAAAQNTTTGGTGAQGQTQTY